MNLHKTALLLSKNTVRSIAENPRKTWTGGKSFVFLSLDDAREKSLSTSLWSVERRKWLSFHY